MGFLIPCFRIGNPSWQTQCFRDCRSGRHVGENCLSEIRDPTPLDPYLFFEKTDATSAPIASTHTLAGH